MLNVFMLINNREQQSLSQQRGIFGCCTIFKFASYVLRICTHIHTTIVTVILSRCWHAANRIFVHVERSDSGLVEVDFAEGFLCVCIDLDNVCVEYFSNYIMVGGAV